MRKHGAVPYICVMMVPAEILDMFGPSNVRMGKLFLFIIFATNSLQSAILQQLFGMENETVFPSNRSIF